MRNVRTCLAAGLLTCAAVTVAEEEAANGSIDALEPVVVSATRTEQAVSSAPASVSVISREDLKNAPASDLVAATRRLPGVSMTAGSQGRPEVSLRGMDSSYTLILVDGKRVNSREAVFRHNDYDLSRLPVEAIERIEVVRGGMSALYGSEAMGGVINVITRDVGDTWHGSVDQEAAKPTEGRDGLEYGTSFYVSGPLAADWGLRVTGGFDRREPWRAGDSDIVRDGAGDPVTRGDGSVVRERDLATVEGREDREINTRLTWKASDAQTLRAEYGHADQQRVGEYVIRGWGEADAELARDSFALSHEGDWAWGNSELRAYGERAERESDGSIQRNRVLEGNGTRFWGDHAFTVGAEARWVELDEAPGLGGVDDNGDAIAGSDDVRQSAIYGQGDLRLSRDLDLLLGARHDDHERFGGETTPRAYLVYSLTPRVTVKGGLSSGFKAPSLRQNSPDSETVSCRGGCTLVGNDELEPETSQSYEAAIAYDSAPWNASVTVFQNDVDDLITRDLDNEVGTDLNGNPYYTYVNVEQARIRGLEATSAHRLGRSVELTANYTYLDAEDRETGEALDHRPRKRANLEIAWATGAGTRLFTRGEYTGEQESGEETLDGYALFDAGVRHQLKDGFDVRAGILNLADQRTDTGDGYSFQERGRALYAGMSARF